MRTILVVDDQPSVRATIGYLLAAHDYQVLLAASTAEALATTTPIDMALIDLYMPGLDGFTLCRTLRDRAVKEGHSLCLVMMTAAWTPEAASKATADGAAALLRKPFTCTELVEQLEQAYNAPRPSAVPEVAATAAA
jgi:CheY-like chemotaxis protein